jgi:SAM-dependent methyltransferase
MTPLFSKKPNPMRPLITKHTPEWLSGIALKGDAEPFENLGTISEIGLEPKIRAQSVGYDLDDDALSRALKDSAPIPATRDREFYHGDYHADYWLSGLSDALKILRTAEGFDVDRERGRYFELGCATARVLRHMHTITDMDCYGCDLNLRHVEWIRMFLDRSINCFQNTVLPNLPLEDRFFDIVSAFSVFTHIDDLETAWLLELKRILKPGGLAYLTVTTDHSWDRFKQDWIRDTLLPMRDQITEFEIDEKLLAGDLPLERTVFWWTAQKVYNCVVFHSEEYLRREWSRHFEILDIVYEGHTYQDVVVLRKPR